MLTVYCDASGKKSEDVMCMWGYVASVEQWLSFDAAWKSVLEEFDVEYFHMREFAHSNGIYKSWKGNENKRRDFLGKLIAVIHANVSYGVGTSIPMDMYDEADATYELSGHMHPYALCGVICIEWMLKWQRGQHREGEPMGFVFDAGDEGHGHLVHWAKNLFDREPTFQPMKETTPLQAADFAVYEEYRGVKKGHVDDLDKILDVFRASGLRLLDATPSGGGILKSAWMLKAKCRDLDIPKRIS